MNRSDDSGKIPEMKAVARIYTDFPTKFGIPRQSFVVEELRGRIVFEPDYRSEEAIREMEGFSHLWLIWVFTEAGQAGASLTVRPPVLGGNRRVGVFASRSPFRPNPIGLTCVKITGIDYDDPEGPVINVTGVDIMDGTPLLDIKPYVPYADCHPDAKDGFTVPEWNRRLKVEFPSELMSRVPPDLMAGLTGVLANDPRPAYHSDPERIYGLPFADLEIRFRVSGDTLTVLEVENV